MFIVSKKHQKTWVHPAISAYTQLARSHEPVPGPSTYRGRSARFTDGSASVASRFLVRWGQMRSKEERPAAGSASRTGTLPVRTRVPGTWTAAPPARARPSPGTWPCAESGSCVKAWPRVKSGPWSEAAKARRPYAAGATRWRIGRPTATAEPATAGPLGAPQPAEQQQEGQEGGLRSDVFPADVRNRRLRPVWACALGWMAWSPRRAAPCRLCGHTHSPLSGASSSVCGGGTGWLDRCSPAQARCSSLR